MAKERNRSLDLMRIICMCMIVGLHFCNHGGLMGKNLTANDINFYVVNVIFALCYVAVNCFVMLSGYFQCESKFKLKRLVSVWIEAAFYSVGVYVILVAIGEVPFSVKEFVFSGMVATMKRYWFVTAYLLMYAVSPFLNCLIHAMGKRKYLACVIVLLGIFSFTQNIVFINDFTGVGGGYTFLWFCVLYLVAGYFRLYVPEKIKHQSWMLPLYLVFALGICFEKFLAFWITPHIFGDVMFETLFYGYNSILCVAASLCFFQFFRGIKIKSKLINKFIAAVSGLTFAVYLISDNLTLRPILWDALKTASFADSMLVVPYAFVCVIGIFAVCCVIEWVRKLLFDKLKINYAVNKLFDKIQEKFVNKIYCI